MADQHKSMVVVEGDSSSYVTAAQKATTATDDFEKSTRKAAKTTMDFSGANEKAAKSSEKLKESSDKTRDSHDKGSKSASGLGDAVKKTSGPMIELAKNATRSGSSVTQLGQLVFQAAAAFGPWGVAIAVAGDLLLGLAERSKTASAEMSRLARLRDAEAEESRKDYQEALALKNADRQRYEAEAIRKATSAIDAKITATEEEIVVTRAWGEDTYEAEKRLSALNIQRLKSLQISTATTEAEFAEEKARNANLDAMAKQLEKAQRMSDLQRQVETERREATKITVGRRSGSGTGARAQERTVDHDEFFGGTLGFGGFSGNVVAESEKRAIASEEKALSAKQALRSDAAAKAANDAQYAADARLRAIEIERATTGETLSLINQEEEARRRLLQTQIDATDRIGEKQQLQSELEQVQHEARLKRIDAERAAEEKKAARKVALMDLVDRVAAGSAATASMIAKTAGASAKKQEQIAAGVAGGQAIIIGVLETVKAAAAFASFNYVQGAMHTAAAAFAYAQGGMLLAQAGGAGGSRGGGASSGGGGMSSGGTQGEPSGQTFRGSDSAIPGSPGPQSPSAAVSSSGPNRTTVVQINGDVYGTPRKEFIRSIREGLDLDRQGGRARRTGSDG